MTVALARTLVVVAALAVLAGIACGASAPSPTAEPVLTPVTSDVPVDLALADRLYAEGRFEEALTIYSAAAQNGTEEQRRQGLWAIARIQAGKGENSAAERTVEAFRESSADGSSGPSLLLLGKAEYGQGDLDEAEEAFEEYVEAAGAAWPYATLFLARIAGQKDDTDKAVALYEQALLAGLPPGVEAESLLDMGRLQEEGGDNEAAIAAYRRSAESATDSSAVAAALDLMASAAGAAGDLATATESLQKLITEYPASEAALRALDDPALSANGQVTTRERARVLFRHRRNDEAAAAYKSIVDASPAGEAYYHLGILAERREAWEEAIAQYDAAIALDDSAWFTAQSTWDRATVLERLGRTDEAIAGYGAVAAVMPEHEEAAPGVFRAGLLSYQLGRPGEALAFWQTFLDVAPPGEEQARAHYWLAKALEALGDPAAAAGHYEEAIAADPSDFYAMRARAVLGGQDALPGTAEVRPGDADWAAFESWLSQSEGVEDAAATEAVFQGEPWLRAVELAEAGFDDWADDEFRAILEEHADSLWVLYRLARRIDDLGRPWVSAPSSIAFVNSGAPPAAFRLAYPLEYRDLAWQESGANGFSPFLLLALVRQESLYDPDAVSSAEAMGLTQVVPATADAIATDLGLNDFTYPDLMRPHVSLQFGAHYLGGLVEGFGGVLPAALAGYNGGPANAGRWWEAAGGDQDLFVETIEYPETRAYVELVLENYVRYLWAYGAIAEPYLP
jgi:soluble lytic murein transglycosylase